MEASHDDDELRPEYDLRQLKGGVRGKYTARYRQGVRYVGLEADVASEFPDEASVNAALREYLAWRRERAAGTPA